MQYEGRAGPDGRAVVISDEKGQFWFKAIVPVPYPIPSDGPVGKLLKRLGRHCFRPSHVHFMFEKEGFDHLITYVCINRLLLLALLTFTRALYLRNDPYETSDAVFGVKESLIVDLTDVDKETAEKYDVKEGTKLLTYDFVLVTEEEAKKLRDEEAMTAMKKLGRRMKIYEGLPVPDVD